MKKYDISTCLLIKDEGRYLPEWLEWHCKIGVQHFFVYDNGSEVPILESVPLEFIDMVTVVDFPPPRESTQVEAYTDCLKRFGTTSTWIAFIDADEFIRVVDGTPLPEFLKNYTDSDAILVKWAMYNANGLLYDDGRPVRERFTKIVNHYPSDMPQHKSIIQPAKISIMTAHVPIATYQTLRIVDENNEPIRLCKNITNNKILIDHYFTKSYEEWQRKMKRGSCDPQYVRENEWFLRMNPEMACFKADINYL